MRSEKGKVDLSSSLEGAPHSWTASDLLARQTKWTVHLSDREIAEIHRAIQRCIDQQRALIELAREDFLLPGLAPLLKAIRRETLWGCGVCLVRGLPVHHWSRLEAAIAFWGLGTHLGQAVSQNAQGHVLGHVTDLGFDYAHHNTRGYQTSARLPYHSDYSDLVALLCLHTSTHGGQSSIASSSRIYLEMCRRRPELAYALTQPVARTRWGEVSVGHNPWIDVPVFNLYPDGVCTTYVRSAVEKAQRLSGVTPLSDVQIEAMDLFDSLACDERFHVDMSFAAGDIQILNNHYVVHSRTAYVDAPCAATKRHLLRLWLACEDGPPFPLAMTESLQGLAANGRPNGIHVNGVPLVAPLEPRG